ncbi:MAG: hypothetical protein MJ104_01500 [Lachnospiraceae bacterium]|nr:hypothetical protein [Lachnospiraceae bacterium]
MEDKKRTKIIYSIIIKILFILLLLYNFRNIFSYDGKIRLGIAIIAFIIGIATILTFRFEDNSFKSYLGIYLFVFFWYLLWAIVIPFSGAPDEFGRYMVPKFILENGTLPYGWEESVRLPMWGFSYAFHPSLPSIISALLMKIGRIFGRDEILYVFARLTSVISGVGVVIMVKKIGTKLFDGTITKLFVISVALLPQFTFLSAYINNDVFAVLGVSIVIYGMLIGSGDNWGVKSCLLMGIGGAMCALSYYNSLGIIIVAFIYATFMFIRNNNMKTNYKTYLLKVLLVVSVMIFITGYFFIRNAINFDGDFLGLKTRNMYAELYADDILKPSLHPTAYKDGLSVIDMIMGDYTPAWISYTKESFIGVFGYMDIHIKEGFIMMIELIIETGIIAFVLFTFVNRKRDGHYDKRIFFYIGMVAMCIITTSLSVVYSYFVDHQPQGRYLMPMLISLTIIFVSGWNYFLQNVSEKIKKAIVMIAIMSYLIVNINCIYYVWGVS